MTALSPQTLESRMILTVTLNTALDVTYEVDRLAASEVHRVTGLHARPGGKGLNVARVLHAVDVPVVATGFAGGATGQRVCELLDQIGVAHDFVQIKDSTRQTVNVVANGATGSTIFNEPGPEVTQDEWRSFIEHFGKAVQGASVVAFAGSLPMGVPADAYASLISMAHSAGVRTIVDTSGSPLRHAAIAAPTVLKANLEEVVSAVVQADPYSCIEQLITSGVGAAVVTMGPAGLLAGMGTLRWHVAPAEVVDGNPTGAGDACTAAIALGLHEGDDWYSILRNAVALSAASVASPVAGEIDAVAYARILRGVHIEESAMAPDALSPAADA
jgi:tagatose 6-phosphate kinase